MTHLSMSPPIYPYLPCPKTSFPSRPPSLKSQRPHPKNLKRVRNQKNQPVLPMDVPTMARSPLPCSKAAAQALHSNLMSKKVILCCKLRPTLALTTQTLDAINYVPRALAMPLSNKLARAVKPRGVYGSGPSQPAKRLKRHKPACAP